MAFDPEENRHVDENGESYVTVFSNEDLRHVLDMLEELAREAFYHDSMNTRPVEDVMKWNFETLDADDENHERLAAWKRVLAAADWMDANDEEEDEAPNDHTDGPGTPDRVD